MDSLICSRLGVFFQEILGLRLFCLRESGRSGLRRFQAMNLTASRGQYRFLDQ